MKPLIFISLFIGLTYFQTIKLMYKNGKTAWNGEKAFYDNGNRAWDGIYSTAYHENGNRAWDGIYSNAYYDNGNLAWDGIYSKAKHDNGTIAWDETYGKARYDNNQLVAENLNSQIQGVKLDNLEISELMISDKIKLLTKTFNNKVYVVGLRIQLSEKNAVLINKENKSTTNIIQLAKDIKLEALNKKIKLSVMGQIVVDKK